MEDWTRVVLYGTYDGFTRSTDGLHRIVVILEGGERIEVPKEFVLSADQMVNKNKIKLKDVIARIEEFDLGTKAVWINAILNKLGSDYGLHKYYAGYKQGKFDCAMERDKVTVPQFVADWIEVCKENLAIGLYTAMNPDFLKQWNKSDELICWIKKARNQDIFARAWLYGYEVKKEKRYEVILSNGQSLKTVYRQGEDRLDFEKVYGDLERFTRKQLEDAGLVWVFDCPGVKVRES